jgi:hypothetical protein
MTAKTLRTFVACVVSFLLALSPGCVNDEFIGPSGVDDDNDGYHVEDDCDDKDPNISPAAPERVNCIDDNCNGQIDEGTDNMDVDGDGWCQSNGDVGDCEGDPNRNPAAAEDGGTGTGEPNGIDDNCNGKIDDMLPTSDTDGDGFPATEGDCNDADPFINPGAIEVEGMHCKTNDDCPNQKCFGGYCRCLAKVDCYSGSACTKDTDCAFAGETCQGGKCTSSLECEDTVAGMSNPDLKVCRDKTDNDCDGKVDEMPTTCDDPNQLSQTDPYDYARAIELCDVDRQCGLDAPCPGKLQCVNGQCRRVLSATFNAKSKQQARAIAVDFAQGGPYKPRAGLSFAVFSTGVAAYTPSNTSCPQDGKDFMYTGTDPDTASADKVANDIHSLELEILVPSNAQSFDFDFHFFSTEYPEFVDSIFNDTFWVELKSQKFNGNISFDKNNSPIRINNAFFSICDAFAGAPQTQQMCTKPAAANLGTGYVNECQSGWAGNFSVPNGGSTDWLHTTSPVTPGEIIKLTFSIFDKGDGILDSAVLIDNFRWKLAPASKPMTGPD